MIDKNLLNSPLYKMKYDVNNNLYIKRDDLIPFSFGGNKVRKAVLFFEDIINNGYDHVVTYGSRSSNHSRVIANIAKSYGIPCTIISLDEKEETFNFELIKSFNANIELTEVDNVKSKIDNVMSNLKSIGNNPYFIQGGGHGQLGTEAYVQAFNEILEYENYNDIEFDYIFFATGTGSTQSGLVSGSLLSNSQSNIVGISIGRNKKRGEDVVFQSIESYLKNINVKITQSQIKEKLIFEDKYLLDGYSSYNKEIKNIVKEVMNIDGIPLDYTYTGKAFWGMHNYLREHNIKDKNILFIHTGGTPLFFTDMRGNEI